MIHVDFRTGIVCGAVRHGEHLLIASVKMGMLCRDPYPALEWVTQALAEQVEEVAMLALLEAVLGFSC